MKLLATSLLLTTAVSFSSFAVAATYSERQCLVWFDQVDRNNDGTLGANEKASQFLSRVTLANDEGGDYIMSKSFFMIECKIGSFGKPPV